MAMLTCIIASFTGCSNKNNKDDNGIDSVAIAQAKADSIAKVDSIAKADSIARADSIAKANTITVGMKVSEALQKPGVKKDVLEDMMDINGLGAYREYDTLILKQKGKKFLTNVTILWLDVAYRCENLKFENLPDSYEGNMTLIRAKDCAPSAKIVKEIK